MFDKLKKKWFRLTHVKCDYCKEPVKVYYQAYLFDIPEYKGHKICSDCIKKLPGQDKIIYM